MTLKKPKRLNYLETSQLLRERLHKWSDKENRLLPERALSERLGTSRGTLRKALAELRSEGHIKLIGRHNFVTFRNDDKFIGILMDSYKSSPFVFPDVLGGVLGEIEGSEYQARILVPNDESGLALLSEHYNLKGLLWIDPPASSWPLISTLSDRNIKVCAIIINQVISEDSPLRKNYVIMDHNSLGKVMASYFLERGHRNIACLGGPGVSYRAFVQEMADNGVEVSPKWLLSKPSIIVEKLPNLLKSGEITGIASNGGVAAKAMFEALSGIGELEKYNLEILLPYHHETTRLRQKNPRVSVSQLTVLPGRKYGSEAMSMLKRQIEEDCDQDPVLLPSTLINPKQI